jgi:hypothetical protein
MSGELPVHNPCMYFTVTKDLANKSHRTLFGTATGVQMAAWYESSRRGSSHLYRFPLLGPALSGA